MNKWHIAHDNAVTWARGRAWLAENGKLELAHAMLCDPPYELAFMNRGWDNSGVAFDPATWAAFMPLLHDGAFCMAFAGSRGWHRMATAIEDADYIMHPSIFLYAFGSGFPKATRIDDPRFSGHKYGRQAIKPAVEPIIVFQKPYAGKPQTRIIAHGAGALNIAAARVGENALASQIAGKTHSVFDLTKPALTPARVGRYPANLLLSHTPTCTPQACADGCTVSALGAQSEYRKESGSAIMRSSENGSLYSNSERGTIGVRIEDEGDASRFFFNADYGYEEIEARLLDAESVRYVAKASQAERNAGLGDNYNPHPAIKPLDLIQHLATLLLPPSEYTPRRMLTPFAGSGSEMIGALLAGWDYVQGIEMTAEYIPVAEARLKFWSARGARKARFNREDDNGQLRMF